MDFEFSSAPVGTAIASCPLARKKEVHWLEIELIGEDSKPIPFARYQVRLPDQTVINGYLDQNGFARIDAIKQPGQCQVSFPELDKEAWDLVQSLPAKGSRG